MNRSLKLLLAPALALCTLTLMLFLLQSTQAADGPSQVPAIALKKTVGRNPQRCALTNVVLVQPGTPVTYCYLVVNTGDFILEFHDLFDDQLGQILQGFNRRLPPGDTFWVTKTAVIMTDTVNTAAWTAYGDGGKTFDVDRALVLVQQPLPRLTSFEPGLGGVLVHTPTLGVGFTTTVQVPPDAISTTATLMYTPRFSVTRPLPPGMRYANHSFDLDGYLSPHRLYLPVAQHGAQGSQAAAAAGSPASPAGGLIFLEPVFITIHYDEASLPLGVDENSLRLYYWTGVRWQDAAATCPNGPGYSNDPRANIVRLGICHLSEYGLVGK